MGSDHPIESSMLKLHDLMCQVHPMYRGCLKDFSDNPAWFLVSLPVIILRHWAEILITMKLTVKRRGS